MIIRSHILQGIKEGNLSLQFRVWSTPRIKVGTRMLTSVGQVQIDGLEAISISAISEDDLRLAGSSRTELVKYVQKRPGQLYKIKVSYIGEDPRIALRNNAQLSEQDINSIIVKLDRWDKASVHGPWTRKVLAIIQRHPATRAQSLADELGFEKDWMKIQIRKLKNLGLTESLMVGYQISPRGQTIIDHL